jgi:CHRD domain
MKGRLRLAVAVSVVAALAVVVTTAIAGGGNDIRERLTGYEEDLLVVSTTGTGDFDARIDESGEEIFYRLSYNRLEDVTQAHIHFGGRHQSGGISVWLCSNLGSPPAPMGTQACPVSSGSVSGVITPADVVGPSGQGIAPGEFGELVDAMRAGVTYANVHTDKFPAGEIRAQLDRDSKHGRGGDKR